MAVEVMSDTRNEALQGQASLRQQAHVLVEKGYPELAGLSEPDFRALVETVTVPDRPFVLVVNRTLVPVHRLIDRVVLKGEKGFTSMPAADVTAFVPTADLSVPEQALYVISDVDTGGATLGVRPDDALAGILAAGRTPLTLEEGLAVATQHPEWLRERNCFEMLGSRAGDKRVTGIWISSSGATRGRPRLGWCWGGNPHTWLGMASASRRVA